MGKYENMRSPRSGRYIANQYVIESSVKDGDGKYHDVVIFKSYDSSCCLIDYSQSPNRVTFGRHWNYSNTTRKWLKIFLENELSWFPSTDDIRKAIEAGRIQNPDTGEVLDIAYDGNMVYQW